MTPMQKLRIRARSGVATETLNNYLDDPTSVRDASRLRIEDAARSEGIPLPGRVACAESVPPPSAA